MAICVGCGLTVVDGIVQFHRAVTGGLLCSDTNGVSVDISNELCNGLELRSTGLWAQCPENVSGISNHASPQNGVIPLTVNTAGAATYDFQGETINVCNLTCSQVSGYLSVQAGGLYIDADPGYLGMTSLGVSYDGAAFIASPITNIWRHNLGSVIQRFDLNNVQDIIHATLDPNDCVTVLPRLRTVVSAGTGTIQGACHFEIMWHLTNVNC